MSSENTTPELRDMLAGHIITGILTAPSRAGVPQRTPQQMAAEAYQLADEMIAVRGKAR